MFGFSINGEDRGDAVLSTRGQRAWRTGLAAVTIVLAVLLAVQILAARRHHATVNAGEWMARAAEKERAQWSGAGVIHATHCIMLETQGNPAWPQVPWLPVAGVDAAGRVKTSQVNIPAGAGYLIDEIWAEPHTGRFRRTIKLGDLLLYGFAFDGIQLEEFDIARDTEPRREAAAGGWARKLDFAELFGMPAGMRVTLAGREGMGKTGWIETGREKMVHDRMARVFQTAADRANAGAAWQVTIHEDDGTPAGVTCLEGGMRLLSVYRLKMERVEGESIKLRVFHEFKLESKL